MGVILSNRPFGERDTALASSESGEQDRRPKVRLLHTADLHIGSDVYANDALRGLDAVLASAPVRADALLIAGDLFDNKRVSDATVDKVLADLGGLGVRWWCCRAITTRCLPPRGSLPSYPLT